jgi:hypothetical protein
LECSTRRRAAKEAGSKELRRETEEKCIANKRAGRGAGR